MPSIGDTLLSALKGAGTAVVNDPAVQAQAVATALNLSVGVNPQVISGPGYAEIRFTPAQEDILVGFINRLISTGPAPSEGGSVPAGGTSKLRINVKMILLRVFLKNYWFVLAGPFMGGFLTGRRTAKRK